MPSVMNPQQSHYNVAPRTSIQKVCIGMGVGFILIGLLGIILPGMMGMHLSMAHNLIHLISGALALWVGYSDFSRRAYNFCIGFGAAYGLLGVLGFLLGQPGYPGVGHMAADQNLLRVIPNVLELGTSDHVVHLLISGVFILAGLNWKRHYQEGSKVKVSHSTTRGNQHRDSFRTRNDKDLANTDSDLYRADLGKSDVNRQSDVNRRRDFERRI
jgi:hypothetical protein